MSSILSTSSCGEGTHTTSLPDCPTSGLYSALGAWAKAQTAVAEKIRIDKHRLAERHTDMFLLQPVGGEREKACGAAFRLRDLHRAGGMMAPPRPARQPLGLFNLCSCRGGAAGPGPCLQSGGAGGSHSARF